LALGEKGPKKTYRRRLNGGNMAPAGVLLNMFIGKSRDRASHHIFHQDIETIPDAELQKIERTCRIEMRILEKTIIRRLYEGVWTDNMTI
jgi:hypothetical protein